MWRRHDGWSSEPLPERPAAINVARSAARHTWSNAYVRRLFAPDRKASRRVGAGQNPATMQD